MSKQPNNISADPIVTFFGKFHFIMFFVLTSIGIMSAMNFLYEAINTASDSTKTTSQSSSFDQATIDRVNGLSGSGQTREIDNSGRINPF